MGGSFAGHRQHPAHRAGLGGSLAALTWRLYELYGDRRILQANYQSMRRYVDFLEIKCTNGVLRGYGGKWDFIGDWVPPGRGMDTTNWLAQPAAEMFNSCCRVHLWEILAKSAAVLGDQAEVARCQTALAAMRPAIHEAFFDATNHRYVIDEQAYQFMPLLVGDVTWVKAHHAAMPGRIVSNWKRAGQKFTMDVRIPANTTATVFVPAKNAEVVTESDQSASKVAGVTFLRIENNAAVYAVGSGTYRFQSTLTEDMR